VVVLKLSSSLRSFQVVLDDGTVFQKDLFSLKRLIERGDAGKFVLLDRLPVPVSASRFPSSPLWQGVSSLDVSKLSVPGVDAYSAVVKKKVVESVDDSVVVDW
jgi:hypothetical protein